MARFQLHLLFIPTAYGRRFEDKAAEFYSRHGIECVHKSMSMYIGAEESATMDTKDLHELRRDAEELSALRLSYALRRRVSPDYNPSRSASQSFLQAVHILRYASILSCMLFTIHVVARDVDGQT